MTKSTKQLLWLVGCLAVLGGAYGGITVFNKVSADKKAEESKEAEEANTYYLSEMEQPVSISFTNSYGTFAFSYDEDKEIWSYDEDEHFPVTQSYLTAISDSLKSLTADRKLEEVQDDLSVYGLDEPAYTVTAGGSNEETVTVLIGSLNSYSSDYYAKTEDSGDVYTIASSFVSSLGYDISTLQEKESLPSITSSSITEVTIDDDGTTFTLEKEDKDDAGDAADGTESAEENGTDETETEAETVSESEASDADGTEASGSEAAGSGWIAMRNTRYEEVEDATDLETMLSGIASLSFADCADYYADDSEKESYGLTDAKVLTITYTSDDESNELVLTIGNTDSDESYYYVSMGESDQVNLVDKEKLDAVLELFSSYFQ